MAAVITGTSSQERACLIMDGNYLGIEAAKKHFGVIPTVDQLKALEEVPFSEETLRECCKTHVLVAVFPISILEIRERVPKLFCEQEWYDDQPFARKTCIEWCLVRKTEIPNSDNKTWKEQFSLIPSGDKILPAQEIVYAMTLHFLVTTEELFPFIYVRTSSLDSDGNIVALGFFHGNLVFDNDGFDVHDYSLFISSARQPNKI